VHLQALKALQILDLNETAITNDGLKRLSGLPVIIIGLRKTPITDAGLAHLIKLQELTTINLASTKVTRKGLMSLQVLPKLRVIHIRNIELSSTDLGELHNAMPKVTFNLKEWLE
jgi:internalin A